MKFKKIIIFTLFIVIIYAFYKVNQETCQSCKSVPMQVLRSCEPIRSAYDITYNKVNCFCNSHNDWRKLSLVIHRLHYTDAGEGSRYSINLFGTKNIPCSDDELQYEEFNDSDIFLYIKMDQSKTIYDGALKELFINKFIYSKDREIGVLDVGSKDREITQSSSGILVKHKIEYDELNSYTLISFQQAIHHDSTYQKQFKNVEYQLINKETRRHDASIRYEDFGERFYLDVF